MSKPSLVTPDHTAVRTALWRALHVKVDAAPPVFVDVLGEKIVGEDNWQSRPDMDVEFCKPMRASIVARARFIEDLVEEQLAKGVFQYVLLGAGLDTFAFRRPELSAKMKIYEIDQPGPQKWKLKRIADAGLEVPQNLYFVPVDFETQQPWVGSLVESGFELAEPATVVSTGVSMYLSKETNLETFRKVAQLTKGTVFAMTFLLKLELLSALERALMQFVMQKAEEGGTPFLSLFAPEEVLEMAREAGLKAARCEPAESLFNRYLARRGDELKMGEAEAFLVAQV